MATDAEALLVAGVGLAVDTFRALGQEMGWDNPALALDKIVGHQVGRQHRNALFDALKLDRAKEFATFETLGNVGSAAAPVTLARADEAGFLAPGDMVGLTGIGSGLNCLMLAIQW